MNAEIFREQEENGSRRLHNMSAPPRMTIELHPIPMGKPSEKGERPRERILGVVDSRRLINRYLQGWRESFLNRLENNPKRKAMLLAGFATGEAPDALLTIKSSDEIYDRFVEMASSIDISPYNLPPFAVAVSAPRAMRRKMADSLIDEPQLAMALLSRISGSLFLRSRAPHFPARNFLSGLTIFYDTTGGENDK